MKLLEKVIKKSIIGVCALALLLTLPPQEAMAYETINTGNTVSLTLEFKDGTTPVSGAEFSLWRVAQVSGNAKYTPTSNFTVDKTSVSLDTTGATSETWATRARALQGYVNGHSEITADLTGTTDDSGTLSFDSAQVAQGLYLLLGDPVTIGDTTYTPTPMLISLPYPEDDGGWDYAPALSIKNEKKTDDIDTDDDTGKLHVLVVWEDNNDALGLRPDDVTIVLSKGTNSLTASIRLAAITWSEYSRDTVGVSDSWQHTWSNVNPNDSWSVTEEDLPSQYTYTVRREDDTFIVTNTLSTQDNTDNNTDNNTKPTTPTNTNTGTKLPQTGQLWWPISFFAVGGMILLLLGVLLRRRNVIENEG